MSVHYSEEARELNRIFRARGMRVKIERVYLTPDSVVYFLTRDVSFSVSVLLRAVPDLESMLADYRLRNGTWQGRVSLRVGLQPLHLEVSRGDPVPLRWGLLGGVPANTFVMGKVFIPVTDDVRYNLDDNPHTLIAGATGCGKTTLLRTMLLTVGFSTSPQDIDIYIVDLKADGDFDELRKMLHVGRVVTEMEDAIKLIAQVYAYMKSTQKQRRRILLVIDEFADFMLNGGKPGRNASNMLAAMAQKGRSRAVNLWLATQKPSAKTMDTFTRANITTRAVGVVADADEARVAYGLKQSGAERLPGPGAFLVRSGSVQKRITAYYASGAVASATVAEINDRWKMLLGKDLLEKLPAPLELMEDDVSDMSSPTLTPELRAIFAEYAENGKLKRGGLAAAMRVVSPNPPTGGPPFRKLKAEIEWLLRQYNSETTSKRIPFPSIASRQSRG